VAGTDKLAAGLVPGNAAPQMGAFAVKGQKAAIGQAREIKAGLVKGCNRVGWKIVHRAGGYKCAKLTFGHTGQREGHRHAQGFGQGQRAQTGPGQLQQVAPGGLG